MNTPEKPLYIGGIYRHFKGNDYELLGVARHSETQEEMVIYRALYDESDLWVRPKAMFQETVVVNGDIQPRFVWLAGLTRADLPGSNIRAVAVDAQGLLN